MKDWAEHFLHVTRHLVSSVASSSKLRTDLRAWGGDGEPHGRRRGPAPLQVEGQLSPGPPLLLRVQVPQLPWAVAVALCPGQHHRQEVRYLVLHTANSTTWRQQGYVYWTWKKKVCGSWRGTGLWYLQAAIHHGLSESLRFHFGWVDPWRGKHNINTIAILFYQQHQYYYYYHHRHHPNDLTVVKSTVDRDPPASTMKSSHHDFVTRHTVTPWRGKICGEAVACTALKTHLR